MIWPKFDEVDSFYCPPHQKKILIQQQEGNENDEERFAPD